VFDVHAEVSEVLATCSLLRALVMKGVSREVAVDFALVQHRRR
jgi:hypothetical protein